MIVSYERVSTTKQQNGIEQQHNDIVRYCDFKQIELDRTFTDFGISGGTDNREQFNEMMKLVKQGLDPKEELKSAGRIGTLAHIMIEQFTIGGKVFLDGYSPSEISQAKQAYYNYLDFVK